jgi:hypothetical protein
VVNHLKDFPRQSPFVKISGATANYGPIKTRGNSRDRDENTSYSQKLHIPASPSDPESLHIRFLVIPAFSGIANISWMAHWPFIELKLMQSGIPEFLHIGNH